MQLDTNNVVGNLYGLRAGLSVISEECDNINNIQSEFKNKNEAINTKHNEILKSIEHEKNAHANALRQAQKYKKAYIIFLFMFFASLAVIVICFYELISIINMYRDTFDFWAYIGGLALSIPVIIIFLTIGLFVYGFIDLDYDNVAADCILGIIDEISVALFIAVYVIGVVFGIFSLGVLLGYGLEENKPGTLYGGLLIGGMLFGLFYAIDGGIRFIINAKGCTFSKRLAKKAEVKASDLEIKERNNSIANDKAKVELSNWHMQKMRIHITDVNNLYVTLKQVFQPILDERDWRHLDLIIYQLETGRAESIKEALQLVDRELQTQRIEYMISSATNAIMDTLNRGFSTLQQSLVAVYSGLSEQLQVISGQMSAVSMRLCEMQAMNSALINKANMTSEALVNDLHRIRSNSDYMRYGIG